MKIMHHSCKANLAADALSRNSQAPAPTEGIAHGEVEVSQVISKDLPISKLLKACPSTKLPTDYRQEQRKDEKLADIICFIEENKLPHDESQARKIAPLFTVTHGILYCVNPKQGKGERIVVPEH